MAGSILSMSLILNFSDFIGISDWHSTLVSTLERKFQDLPVDPSTLSPSPLVQAFTFTHLETIPLSPLQSILPLFFLPAPTQEATSVWNLSVITAL